MMLSSDSPKGNITESHFLVKNMYFNMRVLHLYWYWRECESSLYPARYPKILPKSEKEA